MTPYEQYIRDTAEKLGAMVTEEGDGLRVTGASASCWHRLGGVAEQQFDRRHAEGGDYLKPGRWMAENGYVTWKLGKR